MSSSSVVVWGEAADFILLALTILSLAVPVGTALFDLRDLGYFFALILESSANSKCISASSTPGTSSTIFRACTKMIESKAFVHVNQIDRGRMEEGEEEDDNPNCPA